MSVNTHAQETLERYASRDKNPQFAAAVTGAWGSGKTHFVQNFLESREKAGDKSIYVSLYGVADTAAIDQSIFNALHPILGGKSARFAAKFVKGLLKTSIQLDLDKNGTKDASISSTVPDVELADWLKPRKGTLIVFDDLERSAIDLDVVLGYINSLVEHSEIRCLILVCEDAMTDSQRDKYRLRKEKTIGLSVKIEPDFDAAYQAFGSDLFADCVASYESAWKPIIKAAFEQSEKSNLRLLRHALLYFSWAYDKFPNIAKESNDVVRAFLSVHLPTAFEFLSGGLDEKQIGQFIGTSSFSRYIAAKEEVKSPVVTLADKYAVLDERLRTISAVDFFTALLRDGVVIEEKLINVLNAHPALITASTPTWRRLWFWRDLRETEIDPLAQTVRQQLSAGEFDDLYPLLHATGTLMSLATRGMTTSISAQEALLLGKSAVETLATKKNLHDFERVGDFRVDVTSGHDGLSFSSNIPEFTTLATYANDLRGQQYEKFLTGKCEALLDLLSTDAEAFAESVSELNGLFSRKPLFSRFDINAFLMRIQVQKTVSAYWDVSNGIEHRFIASNTEVYKDLLPELPFFEELDSVIAKEEQALQYGRVARRGLLDLQERGLAHAIAQLRSCKEKLDKQHSASKA
jgi:hypothetical protein